MNSILYFLAGRSGSVGRRDLVALGLAHACEAEPICREVRGGPGGANGLIIADARAERVGYWPESQTWVPWPGGEGKVYLGAARDPLPGPDDLVRHAPISGHRVELADGRRWEIPCVRRFTPGEDRLVWGEMLPQVSQLDESGQWTRGAVHPRYRRLWQLALAWWDARLDAAGEDQSDQAADEERPRIVDFAPAHEAATEALAANYRIAAPEISLLGLLTEYHVADILDAAIDLPTVETWMRQQKKTSDPAAPAG